MKGKHSNENASPFKELTRGKHLCTTPTHYHALPRTTTDIERESKTHRGRESFIIPTYTFFTPHLRSDISISLFARCGTPLHYQLPNAMKNQLVLKERKQDERMIFLTLGHSLLYAASLYSHRYSQVHCAILIHCQTL